MNEQANVNDAAAASIDTTASPFGLTWPIALAAWAFADAAYWLASSILRVAPNLDTVIGAITGSIPIRETAQTALSIRIQAGLIGSAPLVAGMLFAFSVAMYMRRRWALGALAVWAVLFLLREGGWTLSRMVADQTFRMPWSHLTWQEACYRVRDLLLPAAILYFASRGQTRRQFRQWAQAAPNDAQPIWPVAIGWISMYHAVTAMFGLVIGCIVNDYVNLDRGPFWAPEFWDVMAIVMALPSLANAALVVPAVALLKRRPSAGRLHIAGALLVLAALLAEPLVFGLPIRPFMDTWASISSFYNLIRPIVYPVFLVSWFLRSAVERQVAQWREQDAPGIIPAENNAAENERGD